MIRTTGYIAVRGPCGSQIWACGALLLSLVAAGCGSSPPTPQPGTGGGERSSLPTTCEGTSCEIRLAMSGFCPTGGCDPGHPNARGIYAEKDFSYCAEDSEGHPSCPEALVNVKDGVAILQRLDVDGAREVRKSAVVASLILASGVEQAVDLVRFRSDRTQVWIDYATPDGEKHVSTLDDLGAIQLKYDDATTEVKLRLETNLVPAESSGVRRYKVSFYRSGPVEGWFPTCQGNALTTFLGGKRVDAATAEVTDEAEVTTIACEAGAIVACLDWGYTPWNERTHDARKSDYLFGTCLQAKRAAYFVGHGDFTSYTVSGTKIVRRDPFGINAERIDRVEALWSPRGAECLNIENRRHLDIPVPATYAAEVPPCRPLDWGSMGRIATGLAQ